MSSPKNDDFKRFAAFQIEGVASLQGGVHDTTNFANLQSLLSEPRKISFKDVKFSTWNGLRQLFDILNAAGCTEISELPYEVFEEFRIMESTGYQFKIESVFVALQDPKSDSWQPEMQLLKYSEASEFIVKYSAKLADSPMHLLAVSSGDLPPSTCDTSEFIFDYLGFCVTILTMLDRQFRAAEISASEIIEKIISRQRQLIEAIKLIDPKLAATFDGTSMMSDLGFLTKATMKVQTAVLDLRASKSNFTQILNAPNELEKAMKIFKLCVQRIREVTSFKTDMEDAGVELGGYIQKLDRSSELKKFVDTFPTDSWNEGIADEVKEKLNVMDPLIGDTAEEIVDLFKQEVADLESDIYNSMTVIQGFDLARQVLEHRELELSLPWVDSVYSPDQEKWTADLLQFFEKIRLKLVTEQENSAFRYFIQRHAEASGSVAKELEATPGDVMLF